MCRFHLFVILLLEQFNFRLSAEDKKAYFDRLLVFVVDNENIDEIEEEITGNIGNIGEGGYDDGDDIEAYGSDEEIGEVEFEIDEVLLRLRFRRK